MNYLFDLFNTHDWVSKVLVIISIIVTIIIIVSQIYIITQIVKGKWKNSLGLPEPMFFPVLAIITSPLVSVFVSVVLLGTLPIIIIGLLCELIDRNIKNKQYG